MRILIQLIAVGRDSSSIVNFHSDVVFESIPYDVHTCTVLFGIETRSEDRRAYINCISTEVSHVLREGILAQDNMRLVPCLPIGAINCDASTECSNVLSESAAFEQSQVTRACNINETQSLILVKEIIQVGVIISRHHLRATKEVCIFLLITD